MIRDLLLDNVEWVMLDHVKVATYASKTKEQVSKNNKSSFTNTAENFVPCYSGSYVGDLVSFVFFALDVDRR